MSFWQSVTPGQAGLVGSAVNMAGGIGGAIASARQAKKQRDFQKWMMKNRYQLQMEDMRKAGLNPILASGAQPPSPAGASAQISNPAQGAVSSGREAARVKGELDLLTAQRQAAEGAAAFNSAKAINELFRLPEAKNRADFFSSEIGRIMQSGKLGSEHVPQWWRPSSYLGYGVGAGWSAMSELEKWSSSRTGYKEGTSDKFPDIPQRFSPGAWQMLFNDIFNW